MIVISYVSLKQKQNEDDTSFADKHNPLNIRYSLLVMQKIDDFL